MKNYYSSGKLLLTGEYVVLDGALALAVPTAFGQSLTIEALEEQKIIWKSIDQKGNIWFEATFILENNIISQHTTKDSAVSKRLIQILQAAKTLNTEFLKDKKGYQIATHLEFPKNWGLGTSSTLINNISNWANVDAYQLLEKTFGGSGYDIACAQNESTITYQLHNTKETLDSIKNQKHSRIITPIIFNPLFKEHLYFVHLNQKQNSRDGIAHYKKNNSNLKEAISEINKITQSIITCKTLKKFNALIDRHEQIISKIIRLKPVKEILFKDFNGSIKSLGAWGGDFVLVSSKTNPTDYFKNKGFDTILRFDEMVSNIY
ncbi:GYDIA family GHMP kinase [Oceanihabitans sp. 2_MG-2023]|uniref:GYDIA family GHMP kinase n=1 Tax=Oceanihabitans sp. 2_MG-2023 TaxID=3062661 RepID=UPI0026E2F3CA|nr:GYDIA family GHMP kinase [Oceanihabitans sp. 2_MG-2023]MDO6595350.1 GYDIA family GHMP kinase [Oceanihabitans sp. 2_MG-2023]